VVSAPLSLCYTLDSAFSLPIDNIYRLLTDNFPKQAAALVVYML